MLNQLLYNFQCPYELQPVLQFFQITEKQHTSKTQIKIEKNYPNYGKANYKNSCYAFINLVCVLVPLCERGDIRDN